jgi:ribonuclease Z
MAELIMLGTGNAAVTRCYNTCFAVRTADGVFLVDAGGGNGILHQLEQAGIALQEIHDIFITHTHTDHILGVVWVLRMIAQAMNSGKYEGELRLYGHSEALYALDTICRLTLPGKVVKHIGVDILLNALADADSFTVVGMGGVAFDIGSTKARQYGFSLRLPDGQRFTCLGDEPYNERARAYAYGADWLLCEAFCLYEDRERFKPYEKHHSTALDAGRLAAQLDVKHLLLYHTEDATLSTRRCAYAAEAAQHFSGAILVPDDLDRISL